MKEPVVVSLLFQKGVSVCLHHPTATSARPLMAQASVDGNFECLIDPRSGKNYKYEEMKRMISGGRDLELFRSKRQWRSK